jgi:hypothetical protein
MQQYHFCVGCVHCCCLLRQRAGGFRSDKHRLDSESDCLDHKIVPSCVGVTWQDLMHMNLKHNRTHMYFALVSK